MCWCCIYDVGQNVILTTLIHDNLKSIHWYNSLTSQQKDAPKKEENEHSWEKNNFVKTFDEGFSKFYLKIIFQFQSITLVDDLITK